MSKLLEGCVLRYFPMPGGRGEPIRIALRIGKVNFIDERVQFKDWRVEKTKTPFGNLPTMKLADGTELAQSRAIMRLVAKETGLYPKETISAALCDCALDCADDIMVSVFRQKLRC